MKSVPDVTGIPSKYNIPQEEVDAFFQQEDVTPEVELQFETSFKRGGYGSEE